jgi:hypothetical protein
MNVYLKLYVLYLNARKQAPLTHPPSPKAETAAWLDEKRAMAALKNQDFSHTVMQLTKALHPPLALCKGLSLH